MKQDDVKNLIISIRDQTNKLKKTVKDEVGINKSINDKQQPVIAIKSSKSNHSIGSNRNAEIYQNDEFQHFTNITNANPKTKKKLPQTLNNLLRDPKEVLRQKKNITPYRERQDNEGSLGDHSFYTPTGQGEKELYMNKPGEYENISKSENKKVVCQVQLQQQHSSRRDDNIELKNAMIIIENLTKDNKILHKNVEDCTIMIEFLTTQHKKMYKQLMEEKEKSSKIEKLEVEIKKEKARNKELREKNFLLRDKLFQIIDMVQTTQLEYENQEKSDEILISQVLEENCLLREMLRISRLSDTEIQNISEKLTKEESETRESTSQIPDDYIKLTSKEEDMQNYNLTIDAIEAFKKDRAARNLPKKTLSTESSDSTRTSDEQVLFSSGQAQAMVNEPLNSNNSNTSTENHIRFFSADSLVNNLGGLSKDNLGDSLLYHGSKSSSLGQFNNPLFGMKNSLDSANNTLLLRSNSNK